MKKGYAFLIGAALLLTSNVHAEIPAKDAACANHPCRSAATVEVPGPNKTVLRYSYGAYPYLTEEQHITIEPGERLYFRFPTAGDQPGDPVFVRAEAAPTLPIPDLTDKAYDKLDKTDPSTVGTAALVEDLKAHGTAEMRLKSEAPGTLVVTYRPTPGAVGMTLTIEHNFPKPLKFTAFISRPKADGWNLQNTSTCPANTNLASVETWGEPLGMIILEKFKFLDKADSKICE